MQARVRAHACVYESVARWGAGEGLGVSEWFRWGTCVCARCLCKVSSHCAHTFGGELSPWASVYVRMFVRVVRAYVCLRVHVRVDVRTCGHVSVRT